MADEDGRGQRGRGTGDAGDGLPGDDVALSALIDGELSAREEASTRERIAREPELAERYARLAQVDEVLRSLPLPQRPRAASDALRARIRREWESESRAGRRARRLAPPLLAAATAAAIAYWVATDSSLEQGEPTPLASDSAAARRAIDVELAQELERASEEDLGIAFDYETLADLELIEELELLELMVALDAAERS